MYRGMAEIAKQNAHANDDGVIEYVCAKFHMTEDLTWSGLQQEGTKED